jgi:cardiolipin hydrolase
VKSDEIDRILRDTLADARLSRGEQNVLGQILEEIGADQHKLGFLRHRAFEIARSEIVGPAARGVLEWLEDVVKVLQVDDATSPPTAEAYFSPGDHCAQVIGGLFRSARRSVDVCVFTVTDDRISDAIADAHRRKVAVRIISDNDKAGDTGSDLHRLSRRGVPVRFDRTDNHMHHKYAIFDGGRILTGSYNWTRSAAEYNEENFIVTDDPHLLAAFSDAFERLWKKLG